MNKLSAAALRLLGLCVLAGAFALSVASSPTTPSDGTCGPLFEDGSDEGGECTMRDDCNEVCCLCDDGEAGFVAQGCDLDDGTCYGGDAVCQLALDDDPSLCDSGGDTDAGP